ncbi:hypothetical protein DVH24_035737 [Malus domestica]|uniref:Uncharacterized protein n=1 Tax=Malus domestica TaxID=3750 RepID=A0A498JM85_MALDO|nr:hypothetical protein DVH24_035737 [Malus domestica]
MLRNVKSAGTENWEGDGRLKIRWCWKFTNSDDWQQVVDVIDISSVGFDVSRMKIIISCIQINVLEAKA